MEITRPTYLEIDLNNFKYNIEQIKNMVGENVGIMPVLKANAYGTYINKNIEILNEFNIVAVATVDEGVFLRNLGYQKEIFVLNQPFETEIDKIINYDITVGISSIGFLEKLNATKKEINVHVEIGTGMGRTGINPYRVEEYLSLFSENVKIQGIYTHFSSAECDDEYTKKQLKSFNIAVDKAKEILGGFRVRNNELTTDAWRAGWHAVCEENRSLYENSVKNTAKESEDPIYRQVFAHYLDCEAHCDIYRELFPTWNKTMKY